MIRLLLGIISILSVGYAARLEEDLVVEDYEESEQVSGEEVRLHSDFSKVLEKALNLKRSGNLQKALRAYEQVLTIGKRPSDILEASFGYRECGGKNIGVLMAAYEKVIDGPLSTIDNIMEAAEQARKLSIPGRSISLAVKGFNKIIFGNHAYIDYKIIIAFHLKNCGDDGNTLAKAACYHILRTDTALLAPSDIEKINSFLKNCS